MGLEKKRKWLNDTKKLPIKKDNKNLSIHVTDAYLCRLEVSDELSKANLISLLEMITVLISVGQHRN